jgi:hypothetical protein
MTEQEYPLGMPKEYYLMIGVISAQWETIEQLLEDTVADMLGIRRASVGLLTPNIGFRSKIEIILAVGRKAFEETLPINWKHLKKSLERIQKAYLLRNTYVHARWVEPNGDVAVRRVVRTDSGRATIDLVPTNIHEMADAVSEILATREEFARLLETFGVANEKLTKSLEKHRKIPPPSSRRRRKESKNRDRSRPRH